jgi:hypothetical protein
MRTRPSPQRHPCTRPSRKRRSIGASLSTSERQPRRCRGESQPRCNAPVLAHTAQRRHGRGRPGAAGGLVLHTGGPHVRATADVTASVVTVPAELTTRRQRRSQPPFRSAASSRLRRWFPSVATDTASHPGRRGERDRFPSAGHRPLRNRHTGRDHDRLIRTGIRGPGSWSATTATSYQPLEP